jgi:hypothetical protein
MNAPSSRGAMWEVRRSAGVIVTAVPSGGSGGRVDGPAPAHGSGGRVRGRGHLVARPDLRPLPIEREADVGLDVCVQLPEGVNLAKRDDGTAAPLAVVVGGRGEAEVCHH